MSAVSAARGRMNWALVVLAAVAAIVLLSNLTHGMARPQYPAAMVKMVRASVAQANHQASQSTQDKNPLWACLHAAQALNTAQLIQSQTSDQLIERAAGVRMNEFVFHLKRQFDQTLKRVYSTCKDLKPAKVYPVDSAWV